MGYGDGEGEGEGKSGTLLESLFSLSSLPSPLSLAGRKKRSLATGEKERDAVYESWLCLHGLSLPPEKKAAQVGARVSLSLAFLVGRRFLPLLYFLIRRKRRRRGTEKKLFPR